MAKSKILIVDDEPFNVDYLEQELEDDGYETFTASNGQEALDLIRSLAPDLVLLDIMMPVMDGFEVLAHLKADVERRDTPVIVISASNELNSVVRGIKLGAEDYLPKPFDPTLLKARITSTLEKKHLRDLQKIYLQSLERELEIGREIQMGFLPLRLPDVEGWELGAYFKSAKEVAGDYYDAFLLADGNLVCVIGDVCGKGVGAALYMSLFRTLIRSTSKTDFFNSKAGSTVLSDKERLRHVISFTNNYVAETHGHTSMFSTVFIAIINRSERKLTYINGGNEPALFVSGNGEVSLLWPTGPIIGIIPDAEYVAIEMAFPEDSLLLAYTDGVTDALNSRELSFGRDRLLECLKDERSDCAAILHNIQKQLERFTGEAVQFDDITIMAVRRPTRR